jgi:phosphoglucosamine mutase
VVSGAGAAGPSRTGSVNGVTPAVPYGVVAVAAGAGAADPAPEADADDDVGRVLLRRSGTEPVVRVMVEAADHETAQSVA